MKCIKFSVTLRYKRDPSIPARIGDLLLINKKKRTFYRVDFALLKDHRMKMKKGEKLNKYVDFSRKLTKLWNTKVTVIPIAVGPLETIPESLEKGLSELDVDS